VRYALDSNARTARLCLIIFALGVLVAELIVLRMLV
jgi:hypothetical protein